MARSHPSFLERAQNFDGAHAPDVSVEVPAMDHGVDVRAEEQEGQILRAGARAEEVPRGVDAHLEARLPHQTRDVLSRGQIGFREPEARDPALGVAPELAQLLESAAQAFPVDVKLWRVTLLRSRRGRRQEGERRDGDPHFSISEVQLRTIESGAELVSATLVAIRNLWPSSLTSYENRSKAGLPVGGGAPGTRPPASWLRSWRRPSPSPPSSLRSGTDRTTRFRPAAISAPLRRGSRPAICWSSREKERRRPPSCPTHSKSRPQSDHPGRTARLPPPSCASVKGRSSRSGHVRYAERAVFFQQDVLAVVRPIQGTEIGIASARDFILRPGTVRVLQIKRKNQASVGRVHELRAIGTPDRHIVQPWVEREPCRRIPGWILDPEVGASLGIRLIHGNPSPIGRELHIVVPGGPTHRARAAFRFGRTMSAEIAVRPLPV